MNNSKLKTHNSKLIQQAFTLVELMIVVAILGILAAIIVPEFQGHTLQAKEAAAKENLRLMRTALNNQDITHIYTHISSNAVNPFNDRKTTLTLSEGEPFPAEATGQYGWIMKTDTKEIRLDWPGTDTNGVRYYDY